MRHFIGEIRDQWRPLTYHTSYSFLYENRNLFLKQYVKRIILSISGEIARICINLRFNRQILLTVTFSILIAYLSATHLSGTTLSNILTSVQTAIFGLVSLIITAAIFMATLSNQATTKNTDVTADFLALLHKSKNVFNEVYDLTRSDSTVDQKISFVRAHAAESVLDQSSYRRFKSWLRKVADDFKNTPYENEVKYPYTLVYSTIQSRSWPIKEGLGLIEDTYSSNTLIQQSIMKPNSSVISSLKAGINDYDMSAPYSQYAQLPFLGLRLTRTVLYGFAALATIYIYQLVSDQKFNYFTALNLQSLLILQLIAVFLPSVSLVLCVRYIVQLLFYFRQNAEYYTPVSTVTIYPDSSEEAQNSPYPSIYYGGPMV